jgi:WD40 repeat protein
VVALSVDASNRALVTAGLDGVLRVWDFRKQKLEGARGCCAPLLLQPRHSRCERDLLAAAYDMQILTDTCTIVCFAGELAVGSPVARMARHANSALLAVACDDLSIRMFDVEVVLATCISGTTVCTANSLMCACANSCSFQGCCPSACRPSAFAMQAMAQVRRFDGHSDRITDLQVSEDCGWLLSSSMDGTLRVWDIPAATTFQVSCTHVINTDLEVCSFMQPPVIHEYL